jgi:hypothetical protein
VEIERIRLKEYRANNIKAIKNYFDNHQKTNMRENIAMYSACYIHIGVLCLLLIEIYGENKDAREAIAAYEKFKQCKIVVVED